jgi:dolichol-phosphate mannosyltransferase
MDAIFSFSYKPLRLGMALGGLVMIFSLLLSLIAIGNSVFHVKFFGIVPGAGHIGTLLAILFLGSIQLICTGLLGEYIGRIYDEVRHRPLFLIHKVHRSESEGVIRYKNDKVLSSVEDSVA